MTNRHFVLDGTGYHSMLVQMLIDNEREPGISKYFKLVHDDFPVLRIYEVRQ